MTFLRTQSLATPAATLAGHKPVGPQVASPTPTKTDLLRVLLVTPRYFPYLGGVENHVYQVARRLARLGVDTTVLTTDPEGQLPPTEQADGLKIQRVPAWPANRDYYFAPDIYRLISQRQWDIVHLQSYLTCVAPLAMLAALRANVPYVVTFHGGGHSSRLRQMLRGVQRVLLRPLLARAERLIATARFETQFFGERLQLPPERFIYIPNGSDLPAVTQPVPTETGLIVSIGRLEQYKGHHRVIAALPEILEQRPDVHLWIAGSGPYQPTLQRLAQELGVAERVEIRAIPAADRQAMAVRLSQAALVVSLSEYETHPMAILEAIALGRSVLVADTSGLSELAEQGFVRAIALDSTPEQLAQAMLNQLAQPLVPQSMDVPTWDECTAELLILYQQIVTRRNEWVG